MAIDGYDVCGAKLEPADAHPDDESCGLPAGHEGDHYYASPGMRTWFPDEVAEYPDRTTPTEGETT